MKLLAIDTSSGCCSAALLLDADLRGQQVATAREHARLLLPMVQELLREAGLALPDLDGIAFGRGPGSFTGLRIAASVVQGLAFGADLGVLPVSDLRALAWQALRRAGHPAAGAAVLACMDARMSEVYAAVFAVRDDELAEESLSERVVGPEALLEDIRDSIWAAAGRGLAAWPQIPARLCIPEQRCFADAEPLAADVARLAARMLAGGSQWLPPEAAQPVYLRDRVTSGVLSPGL